MKNLFIVFFLIFVGCNDESFRNETDYGCTDVEACNYDPDAYFDDGSCEFPSEFYDCDNHCWLDYDCAGECGGSAELDECGVCDGNGPEECWDGSYVCDVYDCPTEGPGLVEILYTSYDVISAFQFALDNVTILGISGGDAEDAGFTVQTGGSTLIGFSFDGETIPVGEGVLVNVEIEGDGACLSDVIVSGPGALLLDVTLNNCLSMTIGAPPVYGCTDETACNYDETATDDDGSCAQNDCLGVCGGDAIEDECGVCDGDGNSCDD